MIRAAVSLATMLACSSVAHAAEQRSLLDWADLASVRDVVARPRPAGRRLTVIGYPICIEPRRCLLLSQPGQAAPRLAFSAASLDEGDRTRLLQCADRGRAEPCTAVLHGTARRGGGMEVLRIYWPRVLRAGYPEDASDEVATIRAASEALKE